MPHLIEHAKSGRAKCRKCREKIEKDELRFGHETMFEGSPTYQWYHLKCAAEKVARELGTTLSEFDEDVPDRAELEELIAANRKKQKPTQMPYAEAAPSARSSCLVCEEKIAKDDFRVAIEREIDAGGFSRTGAGYLHPACVREYDDLPDDLEDGIRNNSTSLEDDQIEEIIETF